MSELFIHYVLEIIIGISPTDLIKAFIYDFLFLSYFLGNMILY